MSGQASPSRAWSRSSSVPPAVSARRSPERYAEAGAKVACVDRPRRMSLARAIAKDGGEAFAIVCDITQPQAAQEAVDRVAAAGAGSIFW